MKVTWPAPNRTVGVVDALALTGLLGLLAARFVPFSRIPFWGCTLREVTGVPCPGCGLTRVAVSVSHFDLPAAWAANPLGTIAALLFVAAIVASLLHLLFRVPMPVVEVSAGERSGLRVLLVVAVLVNYGWVVVKTVSG